MSMFIRNAAIVLALVGGGFGWGVWHTVAGIGPAGERIRLLPHLHLSFATQMLAVPPTPILLFTLALGFLIAPLGRKR